MIDSYSPLHTVTVYVIYSNAANLLGVGVGTLFVRSKAAILLLAVLCIFLMILVFCVWKLVLGPCFVRSKVAILLLAVLCIF